MSGVVVMPVGGRGGPCLSDRTRDRIVGEVAALRGVTPADILGQGRARVYSRPRQEAMHRLRELGYSFPEIARGLNRLDHTTVIQGVRAHKARLIAKDPNMVEAA